MTRDDYMKLPEAEKLTKAPNQNPHFPWILYGGMSVKEFIAQFRPVLTEAQIATLRQNVKDGKMF